MVTICVILGTTALAKDVSNRAPQKVPGIYPENIPDPNRQGGDTIASATVVPTLPFADSGTTAGYTDDYAGTCLADAGAPDVVYRFTSWGDDTAILVSLCGSAYDTGLYLLDAAFNEIACNDDACGLQSELIVVLPAGGQDYYLVVDGYSSAAGDYDLTIAEIFDDPLPCPPSGAAEGEPPLANDYVDNHNGGCGTSTFQSLTGDPAGERVLCGVSGWYLYEDANYRDTDWFIVTMGWSGAIEVTVEAEFDTYFFELGPQDCSSVGVVQQVIARHLDPATMTITGYPAGAPVWCWIGPTVFSGPGGGVQEYDWVLWFSGLDPVVAVERTTWSAVKNLW
jgi:hypothetical protein